MDARTPLDAQPDVPMVGDHLALDLLNTQASSDGKAIEYWNSGEDVLRWLDLQNGHAQPANTVNLALLLSEARELRALARRLIVGHNDLKARDANALNQYLHVYRSAPHLELDGAGKPALKRIVHDEGIPALLGPIAEAVGQLITDGDFSLVKKCEHPDCVLWFYDRTKSHRRRWCSMSVCGNRYKAAQFRKRSTTQ